MRIEFESLKSETITLDSQKRKNNNNHNYDNFSKNLIKEDSIIFINKVKAKKDLISNCEENEQILTIPTYTRKNSLVSLEQNTNEKCEKLKEKISQLKDNIKKIIEELNGSIIKIDEYFKLNEDLNDSNNQNNNQNLNSEFLNEDNEVINSIEETLKKITELKLDVFDNLNEKMYKNANQKNQKSSNQKKYQNNGKLSSYDEKQIQNDIIIKLKFKKDEKNKKEIRIFGDKFVEKNKKCLMEITEDSYNGLPINIKGKK